MVPTADEPPVVELTDQETAVLEVPVTVAEKARLAPARMLAVAGETETVMDWGAGVATFGLPELQPTKDIKSDKRSRDRKMREECADIVSVVSDAGRGRDNWTEGQKR